MMNPNMLSAKSALSPGERAGLSRLAPRRVASHSARVAGDATKAVYSVLLLGGCRALLPKARSTRGSSRTLVAAQAADVAEAGNFVEDIVVGDIEKETYAGRVHTRFPPEPNGYLHIGHVKSICLNFGIAQKFDGKCNLRFDDTNPESEKQEFIDSIQEDVRWMGFAWEGTERYASDYFPLLYSWAEAFIEQGWAYVDELSAEEISEYRGSVTRPGKDSPYRDRPAEESLQIFRRMRAGEMEQGSAVLRAKIDMGHPNVILRDPIMYRILPNTPHPRTGSEWPIYPSYDWAHGLSDAIEGVTHSVCTLEFNMHNELYDWFNEKVASLPDALPLCQPPSSALPRQHEFARLEMTHIVVSKRKLKRLVEGGYVEGWDDPRMPTISGMRRRGYPPAALRKLCELIGVTKVPTSVIEYTLLENCVRDVLQEQVSEKLLCVLRPLQVTITNWPDGQEDELIEVPGGDSDSMPRQMHFGRDLLLDMEDFQEEPEPGFKRLAPGRQVKLRYGYVIKCDEVIRGPDGEIQELRCSYDPDSLGKRPPKKVAVVHWAHKTLSTPVTVRMYDKLFSEPRPEEAGDFLDALNPNSCEVLASARCEPSVAGMVEKHKESGEDIFRVQFERCGFFAMDPKASSDGLVFNCTVAQRSDFGKAKQVRGKASKKKAAA
ncbi:glnS [Symbiodinium sp. CCMP2592]|nr:glnS [Symbiodinium sp. CCMP2592]